jgi:hypothetical protein
LPSTAAAGDLLTAGFVSDATLTITNANANPLLGWVLAKSQINLVGLYLWWKIAGSSEPKEVKVTPSTSDSVAGSVTEWLPSKGGVPKVDVTVNNSEAGTVSTGTTAATTHAEELAIALFGSHQATAPGAPSYTNSYVSHQEPIKGNHATSGQIVWLYEATKALTTTGTQTTSTNLSTATGASSALLATFWEEGEAPPPGENAILSMLV